MSKAADIAAAVALRLAGISTANGYATNAGQQVRRNAASLDADLLPGINLVEDEDLVESQRITSRPEGESGPVEIAALLPLSIDAIGPCDPANPAIAGHALVADIKRAIFDGDLLWGGRATHTRYVGRTISPRLEGTSEVGVRVQIQIGYVEDLANP